MIPANLQLKRFAFFLLPLAGALAVATAEAEPPGAWQDALYNLSREAFALEPSAETSRATAVLAGLGGSSFTFTCRLRTSADGVVFSKSLPGGAWRPQDKALFIRNGVPCFDVGWVGCIESRDRITDGRWHHLALSFDRGTGRQTIHVDGRESGTGFLEMKPEQAGGAFKLGAGATNFPDSAGFAGMIDDIRIFPAALPPDRIAELAAGSEAASSAPAASFDLRFEDDDAPARRALVPDGNVRLEPGEHGKAVVLAPGAFLQAGGLPLARLWAQVADAFRDEQSRREMAWEREDGIWTGTCTVPELAAAYAAAASRHCPLLAGDAGRQAADARSPEALSSVRSFYHAARQYGPAVGSANPDALARRIAAIEARYPGKVPTREHTARLARLAAARDGWKRRPPAGADVADWARDMDRLARDVLVRTNPALGFGKLLFVRRQTYDANHYYTEYINSSWKPGGGLAILDLDDGSVTDLVPEMSNGVFGRFDLSFDARRIVFAWKGAPDIGYRLYEVTVDGTGLRQLTFPPPDEDDLIRSYRVDPRYHHGTDDMHPCYLPDGGIAFISTRCQYGVLCDPPDNFTTTTLYRMDADGGNLRRLSNSALSEAAPVVMPDGRILYTRWEYVDKGAVSVKCLWAMRPDGSGSAEVYGNDIALPPTLIYGRPIPDAPGQFVVLGTPHYPQNGVGTVIRLDTNRDIRTREPMTSMTPHVDIRGEGGFAFRGPDGDWVQDGAGKGPLYRDPYPLAADLFLVAAKPSGPAWHDAKAYELALLDDTGTTFPLHRDPDMSCWLPYPVRPRSRPNVPKGVVDPELAARGRALCIVNDVYAGLENVRRGDIRYIRVLEQIPRPWAARRRWGGDEYDQQHVCISKDTHLGLKVRHGIVPVETDGSAAFLVPAEANIVLQALDENLMAVQTERTFVDYAPGEVRSCTGCHETPAAVPGPKAVQTGLALLRPPSVPGPQPGDAAGPGLLDYAAYVQPVWDRHCVRCHSGDEPKAGLDLSGTLTERFCVSYEQLVPERRRGHHDRGLLGPVIGENHPKTGNVDYLPAKSLGSHASVLVAMLSKGAVRLDNPEHAARAAELIEAHRDVRIDPEELVKVTTWVDTNCQYYGSYWGKRNLAYRDDPEFRRACTFEEAVSTTPPAPAVSLPDAR